MRSHAPCKQRAAPTCLNREMATQETDPAQQKKKQKTNPKSLPLSLWALQHHWRVMYISHIKEHSRKLRRRKFSSESSQILNIFSHRTLTLGELPKQDEWCGFVSVLVTAHLGSHC